MPANDDFRDGFHDELHDELYTELLVSGSIGPDQGSDIAVEVRRGMVLLSSERQEAGRVAALIFNKHNQQVTHILLSRLGQTPDYRLVPVSLINQVHGDTVLLHIVYQDVHGLPTWQGS